ncbi:MAG: hypothetical protein KDE27_30040 [Planctomycetes bacterium]|nr:hypothetical protein [Planctomycetota bacterium]
MSRSRTSIWLSLAALAACHDGGAGTAPTSPTAPSPNEAPQSVQLGDPLPGLTDDQRLAFERGRALFTKRFTPSEGLGPLYNASSCASCHSTPTIGGGSRLYRNFYVAVVDPGIGPAFQFNLTGLPSVVVPAFGQPLQALFTFQGARALMSHPFYPVVSGQRNSIPIFGVGLFEFVSNQTIMNNADPDDADADGISGRFNNDGAGMGRFGLKAQSNNIEFFTRAPLFNQMGITSNPFLGAAGTVSLAPGMAPQGTGTPNSPTTDADGVPDPEISHDDLGDLIAFSRFLAPPEPLPFDESALRGEQIFAQLGCAKCHMPTLPSSRGPVHAYTDLLLHDMGPALAEGINFGSPQASATSPLSNGAEWRTQPLWGVSKFAPYLHDGRAPTLDAAIRAHGGEASASAEDYAVLTPIEREDLLSFLRHL